MTSARSLSDALVERAMDALRTTPVGLAFIGPDARCVAGVISDAEHGKIFSWGRHSIPMENATRVNRRIVFFPMPCPVHVWIESEETLLIGSIREAAALASQSHLSQCRSIEETALFLVSAAFWLRECGLSSLSGDKNEDLGAMLVRYRQDIVDTAFRFFFFNAEQYLAQKGA